jgi:hypothetical protein
VALFLVLVATVTVSTVASMPAGDVLQVLGRQHLQAWCEQDHLPGEDAELALTTLLGTCPAWEPDDADDVSALDVLVLLLEGNVGLGFLQLTHDLDGDALSLAYAPLDRNTHCSLAHIQT